MHNLVILYLVYFGILLLIFLPWLSQQSGETIMGTRQEAWYILGIDPRTGGRIPLTHTTFKTREDAYAALGLNEESGQQSDNWWREKLQAKSGGDCLHIMKWTNSHGWCA